ncbi:MAG: 1-aminocyclopropane-1-carboxylate deaminase, partial [Campylobacterota bacterium]
GNYKYALQNGMQLRIGKPPQSVTQEQLFVPEGGAAPIAKEGIKLLAKEIDDWAVQSKIDRPKIFLPSGTGTTALYLQKYSRFDIYTCSCVGDDSYLQKQFLKLQMRTHPTILPKKQKYHFGKLNRGLYRLWLELLETTRVEFDLLYDPIGWQTLLEHDLGKNVLYLHQGGLLGNETMLARYRRKYPHIEN